MGDELCVVDYGLILERLVLTAGYARTGLDVVPTHVEEAWVAVQSDGDLLVFAGLTTETLVLQLRHTP